MHDHLFQNSVATWNPLHLGKDDEIEIMEGDKLSELSYQQRDRLHHRQLMANWSSIYPEWHLDLVKMPAIRSLVVIIYVVIIVVGLVSNGVVIFVAARSKKSQSVTNMFVINLSISDLGLCLFSLPLQLHYQLTDQWIFGEYLCRIVFPAFALPMYLSTVTIMLIAIERYRLIVYPLKDRLSIRKAFVLILINVSISVTMAIPVICFSTVRVVSEPDLGIYRTYCVEVWPRPLDRKIYSVCTFIFQFCLPLLLTCAFYCRIYVRLRGRPRFRFNRSNNALATGPQPPQAGPEPRNQKTNKILIAIVANFILCWFPWNCFSLLTELDHTLVNGSHFKLVDLSLKAFAMGSACVNPLLYCWLNDNLRKDLIVTAIKLKLYKRREPHRSPAHRGDDLPQFQVEPPSGINGQSSYPGMLHNFQTASVSMERSSAYLQVHQNHRHNPDTSIGLMSVADDHDSNRLDPNVVVRAS